MATHRRALRSPVRCGDGRGDTEFEAGGSRDEHTLRSGGRGGRRRRAHYGWALEPPGCKPRSSTVSVWRRHRCPVNVDQEPMDETEHEGIPGDVPEGVGPEVFPRAPAADVTSRHASEGGHITLNEEDLFLDDITKVWNRTPKAADPGSACGTGSSSAASPERRSSPRWRRSGSDVIDTE